ncbi:PepSY domain-containing protein [Devosia submarina]|uniref:PepSY domain-containing protein n=1 Tax=Devosia submarina TaxID=1173082 RepID=UPI000D338D6C|nr:PepSY domain-containing protein [Devosia submarina]
MFRNVTATSIALVLLSSAAAASENSEEDPNIHGRSVAAITANLAEHHGINADRVEAWGDKIIVHISDENGANRVLYLNKDTLRPLTHAPAVASRLDVIEVQPASLARWADESARSLLDSDDDGSNSSSAF